MSICDCFKKLFGYEEEEEMGLQAYIDWSNYNFEDVIDVKKDVN